MKLLLENWRQYLTEGWLDTSWETVVEKYTMVEVVDYLDNESV